MLGNVLEVVVPLRGRSWQRFLRRSRWNTSGGAVAAVSLGTAVERGGTMSAASGWRSATAAGTFSWSYVPSPVNEASRSDIWSSKGADLGAVIDLLRRQRRRNNLAGAWGHAQVQLSPRPAQLRAALSAPRSAAERAMVRDGEIKPEQAQTMSHRR